MLSLTWPPKTRPLRQLCAFNVVDDFTWECLAIEITRPALAFAPPPSCSGSPRPGLLKFLICDNGPEFTGSAIDSWAHPPPARACPIRYFNPVGNTYAESFHGRLRDECPNENWFVSLSDARSRTEALRLDY